MLSSYKLTEAEFKEVFRKRYVQLTGLEPDGSVLNAASSFYRTYSADSSSIRASDVYSKTLEKLGESGKSFAPAFIASVSDILASFLENAGEEPEQNRDTILSMLDLVKINDTSYEDYAEKSSEAMELFQFLRNQDTPPKLMNTYKGLRIFHAAEFAEIRQDCVVMKVHRHQAVALNNEGYTSFTHKLLPQQISAKVREVDLNSCTAVLDRFVVMKKPFDRRKIFRLQPKSTLKAKLSVEGKQAVSYIEDVSLRGLSLNLDENAVQGYSHITITFSLPVEDGTDISLRGKVKYIFCEKVCKLGVETYPDPATERVIKNYLLMRKEELEKELEEKTA
ncbi:PilZ domain-containing protein [Limisalsivibrio acetivorans]|uniref:PilZ domain-containing protein n=1 Tax=Limisalsivibrio acetivorans TaxID=1304888 RepID=UPI0003B6AA8D|nr:PilZ domain-containing protein [Limisalsivibrio acetivorans]